jgi:DNA-binding transcriptional LysR family regulator
VRLAPIADIITAVSLPGGIDPSEMLEKQGARSLRDALITSAHPLADLVVDARIEAWESSGRLEGLGSQFGAIRAAGKAIATMSPPEAGRQMTRVATLFTTRYHWEPGKPPGNSSTQSSARCSREVIKETWATIHGARLPVARTVSFEHFYLALEAAAAGLGVTIGPYSLATVLMRPITPHLAGLYPALFA